MSPAGGDGEGPQRDDVGRLKRERPHILTEPRPGILHSLVPLRGPLWISIARFIRRRIDQAHRQSAASLPCRRCVAGRPSLHAPACVSRSRASWPRQWRSPGPASAAEVLVGMRVRQCPRTRTISNSRGARVGSPALVSRATRKLSIFWARSANARPRSLNASLGTWARRRLLLRAEGGIDHVLQCHFGGSSRKRPAKRRKCFDLTINGFRLNRFPLAIRAPARRVKRQGGGRNPHDSAVASRRC